MALPKQVKVLDKLGKMSREWFAALSGLDAASSSSGAAAAAAQADIDATQALKFVLVASDALLPNARVLTAGSGVTLDTSTPGQIKVSASGGASAAANITPDTHPATPTAWDDEFEYGTSLDTTGARFSGAKPWSKVSWSAASDSVSEGGLVVSLTPTNTGTTIQWQLIAQNITSSTWKVRAKIINFPDTSSVYCSAGLMCRESATAKRVHIQVGLTSSTVQLYALKFAADTGSWTNITTGGGPSNIWSNTYQLDASRQGIYFELENDGTSIICRYSRSGYSGTYIELGRQTISGFFTSAPDQVGLVFANSSSGSGTVTGQSTASVDWFRRIS